MITIDFPNAVTNPDKFYDRQSEVERAINVLLSRTRIPVLVIGERRIGKTSLQNVVVEKAKTMDPRLKVITIEPRGCTSIDAFFRAIMQRLDTLMQSEASASHWLNLRSGFHLDTPDQFDQVLQDAFRISREDKIILCVDEFDEIVRLANNVGKIEKERLFGLIHHLIERTVLPISLFFTITRLPELTTMEFPSPLVTKSEIVELLPMEWHTSLGMIEWLLEDKPISLDTEAREVIATMAGGHPYFIKLLVSNLMTDENQTGETTGIGVAEMWKQVIPRAIEDNRAAYAIENLYRAHFSLAEKKVILYMAERGEPVEGDELGKAPPEIQRALRSLLRRNYLAIKENKYMTRVRFLDYWFRNWIEFEEEMERLAVHELIEKDNSFGM